MKPLSKTRSLMAGCVIIAAISPTSVRGQVRGWPVVQSFHATHTFTNLGQSNADTPFLAVVKDSSGRAVYKVECHNGDYDDASEINFSGDFHCALFAIRGSVLTSGDLLATKDEPNTDWWNRGRMRKEQLQGACLAYPEYSTVRHFKLRGILVTLRFADIGWSASKDRQGNPRLEKFTFMLDVIGDKTARAAGAEPTGGPKPPAPCYP